jgi:hypothetical protein
MNSRLFAGAAMALLMLSAGTASAQAVVGPSPTLRAGHIGMPLYMRIPVGSRVEADKLKAEQNAIQSGQQTQIQAQKVRKKR